MILRIFLYHRCYTLVSFHSALTAVTAAVKALSSTELKSELADEDSKSFHSNKKAGGN